MPLLDDASDSDPTNPGNCMQIDTTYGKIEFVTILDGLLGDSDATKRNGSNVHRQSSWVGKVSTEGRSYRKLSSRSLATGSQSG